MTNNFQKAIKGLKPLRLVLGGPSGSGKSKTALIFAKYLANLSGKRTAAVDTEHGRLSLYADEYDFDVIDAEPPFHPNNLIKYIHDAEEADYGQMVIDSSTHFYQGTGGLLEIVQEAAKNRFSGNQYYAWQVGTPIHNNLIDTIIRSPMHIILTSRSKQKYLEEEQNGKKAYRKVGEDLQQRDGLEYELDFALMMDMDHTATVAKGLNGIDTSVYFKMPDEKTIQKIMEELQKDSTVKPSDAEIKVVKKQIKDIVVSNPDKQEKFKSLFEQLGNPNEIKDVSILNLILEGVTKIKNGE